MKCCRGPAAVMWSLSDICHWDIPGKASQVMKRSQKTCPIVIAEDPREMDRQLAGAIAAHEYFYQSHVSAFPLPLYICRSILEETVYFLFWAKTHNKEGINYE